MRDEIDPGTIEIQLPKRRGRPPANGHSAQTAADHSKLYRARRKVAAMYAFGDVIAGDTVSDVVVLDAIRSAIANGQRDRVVELAGELARRYS
ncbi:hypothetical protein [Xanthomonas oryzae]|uniref:hypothetical protein n=1 Tax=Xanthomonas oryzae TaxID=347 RepID=UPI001F4D181F|nr:hypothetical protein [Xanthomonas oryzae]UNE61045.1 hypothetical protein MML47_11335 [Xanthomonas oryzae]UNE61056.1 hypothetical protein MML47_11405 [Xanthomonas oryzae]